MSRKEHYNKKGMYNGYDKNNKEREALDYYSTPTEEVYNILETLDIDFSNQTILEPCAGGGHMKRGIEQYLDYKGCSNTKIIATDIQDRGDNTVLSGKEYDFLSDGYIYDENIDYIIMNPPFSVIEPFVMKALSIANKGLIMIGRLQFLEGEKRYNTILKDYPPNHSYIYVDRISCHKNGTNEKMASAQAYAWFYWDFLSEENLRQWHPIRRVDKK